MTVLLISGENEAVIREAERGQPLLFELLQPRLIAVGK
jgi:hypothetical protein